jgi:hypothetical protein
MHSYGPLTKVISIFAQVNITKLIGQIWRIKLLYVNIAIDNPEDNVSKHFEFLFKWARKICSWPHHGWRA